MKLFPFLLLLSSCTLARLVSRIEIPHDQLWYKETELRVIEVDQYRYHQRITAVSSEKPFPKYAYQWNEYYDSLSVGEIVPLTDSLRQCIHFKNNWKSL